MYNVQINNITAKQFISLAYEFTLNSISTCEIGLDGVNQEYLNQFDVDNEIYIYKSGSVVFRGIVTAQKSLNAGGLILQCMGVELELTDNPIPITGTNNFRVWTSSDDHTILNTLITSVTGWTLNTTNSTLQSVSSFRATLSESVWNAMTRLLSVVGKDIYIDQENKIVYLYNKLTRADKFAFIEGKNATNINRLKKRSQAGKVIVYGKGDGKIQITGSFGSGTPVKKIIDRNIISNTEANLRAQKEYNKLNPQSKYYSLEPVIIPNIRLGDSGLIVNNSAKINETVDIVRLKYFVKNNGDENLHLEVTNPDYRIAKKNLAEERIKSEANYLISQSSMQGSGNTLTWGGGINAKSGFAGKFGFYIPEDFVTDEAGNINITSLTLDYELNKYLSQFGDAEFTGTDPAVQNNSGDKSANVSGTSDLTQPIVTGTSDNTQPGVMGISDISGTNDQVEDSSDLATSVTLTTTNSKVLDIDPSSSNTAGMFIWLALGRGLSSGIVRLEIEIVSSSGRTFYDNSYSYVATDDIAGTSQAYWAGFIPENTRTYTYDVYIQVVSGTSSESNWQIKANYVTLNLHAHTDGTYIAANHNHTDGDFVAANHSHTDGNFVAAEHEHPSGTYDINAADLNFITINSGVSESASINSTSVDLYLQYWNGTSWVTKNTILNTGKIFDQDVDLSDSGTYPDSAGWWRVLIEPNSLTPDFVSGIINIKHSLDN